MATSIPPHNLGEVIDACVALINQEDLPAAQLLKYVKGPDFPTGGQLHATRKELEAVYADRAGLAQAPRRVAARRRGRRRARPPRSSSPASPTPSSARRSSRRSPRSSSPRSCPRCVDVRDESTAEVRIVLELKKGTDPQLVMAYLFKNTPLSRARAGQPHLPRRPPTTPRWRRPKRLSLAEILRHFLDFRFATVTRRAEFDLARARTSASTSSRASRRSSTRSTR